MLEGLDLLDFVAAQETDRLLAGLQHPGLENWTPCVLECFLGGYFMEEIEFELGQELGRSGVGVRAGFLPVPEPGSPVHTLDGAPSCTPGPWVWSRSWRQ